MRFFKIGFKLWLILLLFSSKAPNTVSGDMISGRGGGGGDIHDNYHNSIVYY